MQVKIVKLSNSEDLTLPYQATAGSAGMDLCAAVDEDVIINPGQVLLIPTGIAIALPNGYEAQIRPRSGIALKNQVTVLNTPGTIDADYRGEIKVMLYNLGNQPFVVNRGMRIAQMVISRYETIMWDLVEELPSSERGEGGFGSTGTSKVLDKVGG